MQAVGQPFLHRLVACVRAPTCVLSADDGQIRHDGTQGLIHSDVRHLAELVVTVDGHEPLAVGDCLDDGGQARFVAALVDVGDPISDPTVRLERSRTATADGFVDDIAVVNDSRADVSVTVVVSAACDMATLGAIKLGTASALIAPTEPMSWQQGPRRTELHVGAGARVATGAQGDRVLVRWTPAVASRTSATLTLRVEASGGPVEFAAPPRWAHSDVIIESGHPALAPLVTRSLEDLEALLLTDGDHGDVFAAAGTPWYLTLFGRDSLWAARMALPVDVRLAGGTLAALARRQAVATDIETAAEPGKILHEVRAGPLLDGIELPPLYYGTVDATPLWISVLHDAWCWGLDDATVAALLDPLVAAAGWLLRQDGFLSYRDASGHGMSNQGWKDSGDAVQDRRGRIADAPITLCEVQGYAHRAALDGARLLDAFDRPGAGDLRRYAAELRDRFRAAFWITNGDGTFPAIALDGRGEPVDSLTSNIGHLPATGILDAAEIALVADHLAHPRLDSGYGLRTLADDHPRFNPLGYHTGTVWPHDTAIAIDGLAATGHATTAAHLAGGLLAAAVHFGARLPELFAGWSADAGPPAAYPAACRPQAWAAGAGLVVLRTALGLRADVPAGSVEVRPDPAFAALFPLSVRGLRVGSHELHVRVDADGRPTVETDAPLTVITS
jgi:glycogen debranching enzyme